MSIKTIIHIIATPPTAIKTKQVVPPAFLLYPSNLPPSFFITPKFPSNFSWAVSITILSWANDSENCNELDFNCDAIWANDSVRVDWRSWCCCKTESVEDVIAVSNLSADDDDDGGGTADRLRRVEAEAFGGGGISIFGKVLMIGFDSIDSVTSSIAAVTGGKEGEGRSIAEGGGGDSTIGGVGIGNEGNKKSNGFDDWFVKGCGVVCRLPILQLATNASTNWEWIMTDLF